MITMFDDLCKALEAQQRYFSYRAVLLAIVSPTSFCACVCVCFKWGIAQLSRDML